MKQSEEIKIVHNNSSNISNRSKTVDKEQDKHEVNILNCWMSYSDFKAERDWYNNHPLNRILLTKEIKS